MQIKLKEVTDALGETAVDRQFYYYIPEERIIEKDEELKEKDLIPLPTHKEIDDYGTMKAFIEEKCEGEAGEWLAEAIRGAGAFRRFRTTLDRFGLTEQWYEYLEDAHENIAIDWCEYYGIEYLEERPFAEPVETVKDPGYTEKHNYRLITISEDNVYSLAYLVGDFRKTLAGFKNSEITYDVDDAVEELRYYLKRGFPVFAISDNGRYVGYGVCRIDDDVVWLEQIFVRKEYRRRGIGKMLFERAQAIAEEYGNSTLYQFVHPNNDVMLEFLKNNGYDVLNLIEIRRPYKDEKLDTDYQIGDHHYRY